MELIKELLYEVILHLLPVHGPGLGYVDRSVFIGKCGMLNKSTINKICISGWGE